MAGLLGLTKSVNSTESAVRDLSVLERMDARLQQDKQAEINAQKEEQMMYERAYQMSDQLLEKDRNRINSRISMAQEQIASHMRKSGGDRSMFMENGGLGVINGITNDITRSPEAIQYQENKKNLTKIWMAQEKGLGHLLSPKDLKSLEDYENNENGGPITYSGMMAEIKIPPSSNFDYGTDIPLEKVMSYDSNMVKILGNFAVVHPEKDANQHNIIAFMKEMGYGGQGSNQTRQREAATRAAAVAKANAENPTKKENTKNSYIGQYTMLNTQISSQLKGGLTLKNIEEQAGGSAIEYARKNNPQVSKMLVDKNKLTSRKRNLSEEGFDITDLTQALTLDDRKKGANPIEYMFNEHYGLFDSYEFMPMSKNQISKRVLGKNDDGSGEGYEIKDNQLINYVPDEGMFRMDGVQVSGKNKLDREDHKGNYIIENVVTGFKGKDKDGLDNLIMNAYDDDGVTLDEKTTKKIRDAYKGENGGDELKMSTFIALRNTTNGDIFYKEIDITRPDISQAIRNATPDDNVAETVNQEHQMHEDYTNIKKMKTDERIKLDTAISSLETDLFANNPILETEGSKYYGAYSGGQQNRYPMMKSFYMAHDYVSNSNKRDEDFPNGDPRIHKSSTQQGIDRGYFTTAAIAGGIENDLKTYGKVKDADIVYKWLDNMNQDLDDHGQERNRQVAEKWIQLMTLMENQ